MDPPRRLGRALRPSIKLTHSLANAERAEELDRVIKRRKKTVHPLVLVLVERDPSLDIAEITI